MPLRNPWCCLLSNNLWSFLTMRYFILLTLLVFPFVVSPIARAQFTDPIVQTRVKGIEALSRAKNLARQAGEAANGGLEVYRAERSMHGSAAQSPYVDQDDFWLFTFKGNAPGSDTPYVETEVRVDKADSKTTVLYNGAIR
ncbi:MAG: hypothetical protein LH660_15915 [Phormidesmis sp. CAN_BIN36]|nr:hypothetical protein [Phormidesmis sp. CAN_BIN36]